MWNPGSIFILKRGYGRLARAKQLTASRWNCDPNDHTSVLCLVVACQEVGFGTKGPKLNVSVLTTHGLLLIPDAWKVNTYFMVEP